MRYLTASRTALALLLFTLCAAPTQASEPSPPFQEKPDLGELKLEELLDLQVTTVSKKAQQLAAVPAAISVITGEEIRRSGATSLPELLRLVPGVNVARVDGNKWAVSIRGFNGLYADLLQVMIDGRIVYSPLFSGVHWDVQDTLLEDIERIEVVRGPGGSLWGANAVNGIINVVTRHARDTEGGLAVLATGDEEPGMAGVRQGGAVGPRGHFRAYGKYFTRDGFSSLGTLRAADDWDNGRGGFRYDRGEEGSDSVTVQGEAYRGRSGGTHTLATLDAPFSRTTTQESTVSGWHLLGRWNRGGSSGSERSLQLYLDRTHRETPLGGEKRLTLDVDFQRRHLLADRHDLVWGLGYRRTSDRLRNSSVVSFDPAQDTQQVWSAFAQDEIRLNDRLRLTLGSKLMHFQNNGLQLQPSLRVLWQRDDRHTYWASVSRAVRTPDRADRDARFIASVQPGPGGLPVAATVLGNRALQPSKLLAYELGTRFQRGDRASLDLAAFFNQYDDLVAQETGNPIMAGTPEQPYIVVPLRFGNFERARTFGVEVSSQYRVRDHWRLTLGGSLFNARFRGGAATSPTSVSKRDGSAPRHQFHVGSYLDLPGHLELDALLYSVGRIHSSDVGGYSRLDLRLGWRPTDLYEVSVGVQNLLDEQHQEFTSTTGESPGRLGRRLYGKVTWRR